jgi:glycerol-3-phosphate acyltransferase PlsY
MLAATRIVSASALTAAAVFLGVHFWRTPDPWSNGERVLSGALVALGILMVWRHRANLVRLAKGTEPRIGSRRERKP